jgi:hypothetical protein
MVTLATVDSPTATEKKVDGYGTARPVEDILGREGHSAPRGSSSTLASSHQKPRWICQGRDRECGGAVGRERASRARLRGRERGSGWSISGSQRVKRGKGAGAGESEQARDA